MSLRYSDSVPLIVALLALLRVLIAQVVAVAIASRAQRGAQQLEDKRARAALLQSCLDLMAGLIVDHGLRRWVTLNGLRRDEVDKRRRDPLSQDQEQHESRSGAGQLA